MRRRYWILLFIWCLALATLVVRYVADQRQTPAAGFPATATTTTEAPAPVAEEPAPPAKSEPEPTPPSAPAPSKTLKDMKFYSQAPYGIWDPLHEDACEEASVYMVKYWLDGATPALAHYDQDLKNFINWQTAHEYGISVSVQQLKQATHDFVGMDLTIKTIVDINELKAVLDKGNPIIFPADGKRLNNPNFTDGGPIYHMLVVVGYSGDTFITKDPGTRHGDGFKYSAANLSESLGNWNGHGVDRTDRRILVLE